MTPLYYKKLHRYKYVLHKLFRFNCGIKGFTATLPYILLFKDGEVTLKIGYAWNGANIVRDTKATIGASLHHDPMFQLLQMGIIPQHYRPQIDQLYIDIALELGMWKIRAAIHLSGLNKFSKYFCRPGSYKPDKIYCIGKE